MKIPLYDMYCPECGHEEKDVMKKHDDYYECSSCGYPMKNECACASFKLVYNNRTDMCDWAGNSSMYWKDYHDAKSRGEKVKPAGED